MFFDLPGFTRLPVPGYPMSNPADFTDFTGFLAGEVGEVESTSLRTAVGHLLRPALRSCAPFLTQGIAGDRVHAVSGEFASAAVLILLIKLKKY